MLPVVSRRLMRLRGCWLTQCWIDPQKLRLRLVVRGLISTLILWLPFLVLGIEILLLLPISFLQALQLGFLRLPHQGPRNPTSAPPYMQGHQPVNQGMYQANGPYGGVAPYGSQGGIRRAPYPQAWSEFADPAANHGYHPRGGMTGPSPRHQGTPNYGAARSPSVNHGQGNPTWVGNTHRPNSGYGGHQFPSSGRGQGHWHGGNRSPGFGRGSGSGRGRGFNNHGSTSSGKQDPRQFYDASMMEDPWESLKPTEWKGITGGSSESWMPRSIGSKRPRGSSVPSFRQENSGQSLASYLASSFNEASNAEQNT
ncbi:Protein SICKLE [Linum perenne]